MLVIKPGTRSQRAKAGVKSAKAMTTKAASRGASAKRRRFYVDWRKLTRGFGAVILTVTVGFAAVSVDWATSVDKLQAVVNKPVSSIAIKGEFAHLSKADIQMAVLDQMKGDFVDLNLRDMRAALEQQAWVKAANVRRIWPDRLEITVQEQKPIARWGRSGFINAEGQVIDIEDNNTLSDLPLFYGPPNKSADIAQTYLAISEMLATDGFGLTGIQVDETLSWSIHLAQDIELVIGQYNVLEKLQNFLLVYRFDLVAKERKIARVDMRYENGMAVSWQDDAGLSQLQASR